MLQVRANNKNKSTKAVSNQSNKRHFEPFQRAHDCTCDDVKAFIASLCIWQLHTASNGNSKRIKINSSYKNKMKTSLRQDTTN